MFCANDVYESKCNTEVDGGKDKVHAEGVPAVGFDEML